VRFNTVKLIIKGFWFCGRV